MRIIKLQNNKIKGLLEEKGRVVVKGRKLSAKIEKDARKIIDKEMEKAGIKVKGDVYSGKYEQLKEYFAQNHLMAVEEIVKSELKEDLAELDKMGGFINKYNNEISRLVDKEKLELDEFEELTKIELVNGRIEIEVEDAVEEFKKRLREKNGSKKS